jgi:predicted dehydrogenase
LVSSWNVRLRVGVIGLGRLWEARHKPALMKLRDRFQVTAVYDQVMRRAELEAAQLGCRVAEGLTALMERPDVDVIYLLTPQWFGLYPIQLACSHGKPIYCALPLASSPEELEALAVQVESSGVPFMPEFARRFYPATLRLHELLATVMGPLRLILGQNRLFGYDRYGQPGPTTQMAPAPLLIDPGSYLLDWCSFLFQSQPSAVLGNAGVVLPAACEPGTVSDFESFVVDYPSGGMAQIAFGRYHRSAWGDATRFLPQTGFQVYAERGAAWLELPDRIQWSDPGGTHDERLPLEPTVGEAFNKEFHRLVRGEPSMAPTIRDALAVAHCVADLGRSQEEGRKIVRTPAR